MWRALTCACCVDAARVSCVMATSPPVMYTNDITVMYTSVCSTIQPNSSTCCVDAARIATLGGVVCDGHITQWCTPVCAVLLLLHPTLGGVVCDGHSDVHQCASVLYNRIPVLVVKFSILFSLNHSPYERAISYTIYYHITVSKSWRSWNVLIWIFIYL